MWQMFETKLWGGGGGTVDNVHKYQQVLSLKQEYK